jgi:hypothetical protein
VAVGRSSRSLPLLCVPCQGALLSLVETQAGKLSLQPEALGAGQEATNGLKHPEKRPRRGSADRAGRNVSEHRAGLESSNVGADPPQQRGRPPSPVKRARHAAGDPTGVVMAARTGHERCATREVCGRDEERHLHANGEPVRASTGDRRWRMGSYYCRGRVTPAEGRSPDPAQARKGPTAPVIDDESTNTARKAEKSRPPYRRKLRLDQSLTGWKCCGRSSAWGTTSPDPSRG